MGLFDKLKKKTTQEDVSEKEAKVEDVKTEETSEVKKKKTTKKTTDGVKTEEHKSHSAKNLNTKAYSVLLRTLVSEKAAIGEVAGVYTFVVSANATKIDIKKAVKDVYGVLPVKVRIVNAEGKNVNFGYKHGRRNSSKKAFVTLPKGKTISIHEGV